MNVIDCADYVVSYCERIRHPVTNNQMNLILCLIRNEFKRRYNRNLYEKATCRGPYPSFHSCYSRYLVYGAMPINKSFSVAEREKLLLTLEAELGKEGMSFLSNLLNTLSRLSVAELFHMYEREKFFI